MNNTFLAPIKARATIILAVTGADCYQTLPLGEAPPKLPRQKLEVDPPLAYRSQITLLNQTIRPLLMGENGN